ncbi:DUF4350 domain-containing protein [Halorussus gelatinilyticus]|uniref:DUF4350 domain-containing protein n=1 Tax=Halorussus gelatinilyticus TaxID=2937524 RepID=A0A8U0ID27_9EURY|nr:DUF4350 domain-containing protein [Halorussus gelatinilyticus]UPV98956.1 DUF4350 domain-containing protein [Halorussus gelatinilyticus]
MSTKSLVSPKRLLLGFGILTVVTLFVAASTSSAAFGIYNSNWDGTSKLEATATATGATTTIARETTAYGQTPPTETIGVILSPDQPYTAQERQRLYSFVQNGGTLIVAGDYGSHANRLLASLNTEARLDGQPLRDEQSNYRSPAMPVVNNITNRSALKNVSAVTLNHGTAVNPNNSSVLLTTSVYAYLDTNQNETLDSNEAVGSYPVVTSEQIGDGTVVVVGDPSLFINTMLDQSDNRAFARALFTSHQHVILDYSHTSSLPPLAVALLIIRNSALLQFVGGVLSTLAILGVLQTNVIKRLKQRVSGTQSSREGVQVSDNELANCLRAEHPDWDEERIQRVVNARRNEPNRDAGEN